MPTDNPAQAIRIASSHVRFYKFGKRQGLPQYQVDHFSEQQQAWHEGHILHDRASALRSAWEHKVCIALQQLNVDDASTLAYEAVAKAASEPKFPDWRRVVRDIYRGNGKQES